MRILPDKDYLLTLAEYSEIMETSKVPLFNPMSSERILLKNKQISGKAQINSKRLLEKRKRGELVALAKDKNEVAAPKPRKKGMRMKKRERRTRGRRSHLGRPPRAQEAD